MEGISSRHVVLPQDGGPRSARKGCLATQSHCRISMSRHLHSTLPVNMTSPAGASYGHLALKAGLTKLSASSTRPDLTSFEGRKGKRASFTFRAGGLAPNSDSKLLQPGSC